MKAFYLKPELFSALKTLKKEQFVKDIISGIIVAIIAFPLSIAMALASGVEPVAGVYTALAAGFVVPLFGGSAIQITGPTAALSLVVAGIVAAKGMEGLILSTVMAGVLLVLMGICKMGGLIRFVPATIARGFTTGIGVNIFLGQIKDFFGLQYAEGVKPVETVDKILVNVTSFSTFTWQALLIGIISLAILVIYPKLEKKVPPSLVAVLIGSLMVKFIPGLGEGVFTIGELYEIPSGLPPFTFAGLDFSAENLLSMIPDAFTIAVLAAIVSLLSCVVSDTMVHARHNPNAELVGQGVGNIVSVMLGGIPSTGAIARTTANAKNGGRTPLAAMVHAVVLLLILLILMPLAKLIPMPTIAAILIMASYNMSEIKKFSTMVKTMPIFDVLVLLITFVLTIFSPLIVAIGVGLALHYLFRLIEKMRKKKKA